MKISKRERSLLGVTIVTVVFLLSYFLLIPLFRSWGETGEKLKNRQRELAAEQATIQRRDEWRKQYDELKQSLGQKSEAFQQIADVLKKIQEVASTSGVQVQSTRPLLESDKGVYRELPVQCAVEARTESLVRFLFALQSGAGFISVEQLQVAPKPENPGILRCDIQIRALAGKMGNTKS